jgi:selenocysteine lyase/cysteine desulfurase
MSDPSANGTQPLATAAPEPPEEPPAVHSVFQGLRVTPNVYTTLDEIDTFAEIVEGIAKKGAI